MKHHLGLAALAASFGLIVLPACVLVGEYTYESLRWHLLERRARKMAVSGNGNGRFTTIYLAGGANFPG